LYDAWVLSIMIPLVEIAKDDLDLFNYRHNNEHQEWSKTQPILDILKVEFDKHMPEEQWPHVLDWSYSNLSTLFDVGYEAGLAFFEEHEAKLMPDRPAEAAPTAKAG
jgi:hypothetical protein